MRPPSDVHHGSLLPPGVLVSVVAGPPADGMVRIWAATTLLAKAIFAPSGDHAGLWPGASTVQAPPAAGMAQICDAGAGPRSQAILVPSGDHAGLRSMTPGELVRFWGVPEPSAFIRQRSKPVVSGARLLENTIFVPSGDQRGNWSDLASLVRRRWPEP